MAVLGAGSEFGPYWVVQLIGTGGIGEVYRAVDTRLGREVALKILLPEFFDAASRKRFEQEARAASSISHPNLVTVFEAGEHQSRAYLAMELLHGSSLRELLADGPLHFRVMLPIAIQVARGLSRIHEAGIVHRDLKPENVMIGPDGTAKIVDFGLAKLFGEGGFLDAESRLTQTGFVVGTAAYVSPEQARADHVYPASDQFTFGILLYEALSGLPPFRGEAAVQVMTSIIEDAPEPLQNLVPGLPVELAVVVEKCLEKDPSRRFPSTSDLLLALEGIQRGASRTKALPGVKRIPAWKKAAAAGVLAIVIFALGLLSGFQFRRSLDPGPMALFPLTYSGLDSSPAVSPDGRLLAFASQRDGVSRIWLKVLQGGAEAPLTGGPDDNPRFSPDGNHVLFVRQEGQVSSLFRVPVLGGTPRKVLSDVTGADWSPDGNSIVFTRWTSSGVKAESVLGVVPSEGGAESVLSTRKLVLLHPRFSPSGRYVAVTSSAQSGIQGGHLLYDVAGRRFLEGEKTHYGGFESSVAFTHGDGLVFLRSDNRTPFVVNVDRPSRLLLQKPGQDDAGLLLWAPNFGLTVDLLPDGRAVLESRTSRGNLQEFHIGSRAHEPVWVSRGLGKDRQPCYSRDSAWLAFSSLRTGNWDVWLYSRTDGSLRNVTEHPGDDWDPAFAGNPPRLFFSSNRTGNFEVFTSNLDGSMPVKLTSDGVDAQNPSPSPDGDWLVYASSNPAREGLWKLSLNGRKEIRLLQGRAFLPEVSPDGRFVLFMTGVGERGAIIHVIHAQTGLELGYTVTVGSDTVRFPGAGRARWMPDGRGIAFLGPRPDGGLGVLYADFDPEAPGPKTVRPLLVFESTVNIETFGLSPDAEWITAERVETLSTIAVSDVLPRLKARGPLRLKP